MLKSYLKKASVLVAAISFLTAGAALAQDDGKTGSAVSAGSGTLLAQAAPGGKEVHASVSLIADTTAIVPGKPFKLGVELKMEPHWHTYYKESGDAGMPTKITWNLPKGFTASELLWEKPLKFVDAGITTYGYENRTLIGATITPPADLKSGQKLKFTATVKWLTCHDVCVPGNADTTLSLSSAGQASPANAEAFAKIGFTGKVSDLKSDAGTDSKVTPAVSLSSSPNAANAATMATSVTTAAPAGSSLSGSILDANIQVADNHESQLSLWAYLGLAFVGGFILNFMPCVLPVISIKVLSFMQQAGDDPQRVFNLGMTFTAGIVSSFMALAAAVVGIQAAGAKIGWGFQFQFPLFLLAMSTVVLMFALSLFGLFYISVNAGQDKIDKLASKEGFTGTFFKGVLATTLSTPCSAPFLGTALGFAFSQPAWVVFLIFFMIAAGMSFPYVLLTAQPAWMKYIPKPGVWMEKFKESMGFLLLATVVWLMWVLGQQVGLNATMAAVGFLVLCSFAVWLVGRFTDLTSTNQKKAVIYSIAGVVVFSAYFTLLRPFPQLLSLNPAQAETKVTAVVPASYVAPAASGDQINWVPFSINTLDSKLQAGKTVFVDFTADWCLTCKVNENTVINTAPVREKIKALNVVTLRADWTRQDPEISRLLQKFGRSGVPLYVIFPAGRPTQPEVLPEAGLSPDLVAQMLEKAGPSK